MALHPRATTGWVVLCAFAAFAQPPRTLKEVRFWTSGDITRVALETDEEAAFDYDRISSPDRIYIDLYDTRPSGNRKAFVIPVQNGVVKQVRVAMTNATSRVVLDLDSVADFSVSQLANPNRVVVEVRARRPVSAVKPPSAPDPAPALEQSTPPAPPAAVRLAPKPFVPPAIEPKPVPPGGDVFSGGSPPAAGPVGRKLPPTPAAVTAVAETKPEVLRPRPSAPRMSVPPAPPEPDPPSAASEDSTGQRSLARILGLKLNRVVLDAGHGGNDPGNTSPGGIVEKELVLDVTLRLGRLIERTLGAQVIYTRRDDRFVPLEARAPLANEQQADLFLSIHANSAPYRAALGPETYVLNFTSVKADMDVAARENASSRGTMHQLPDLVTKIAKNDKAIESREFAARIQGSMYELGARTHGRLHNRGVKRAPFVVLIGATMPAVLVEIGFLTNPREESLLAKSEHRQRLAEALCKGVMQYAESLGGVRVAQRASASGGQ